jgi:hypothetical protein
MARLDLEGVSMEKLEFKKEDLILQALSSSDERLALLIDKVGD